MSEFMDQAKKLASEHSEQADQGLDKAVIDQGVERFAGITNLVLAYPVEDHN